ncbi:alpha/beta fold hydrolase [Sphingomonas gilva]|uniref:Alpha/beta fold hydrolase n=1 Tax=Sphingomonas gilva TaxID=2305907 RepID=A0A396RPW1_9SPHN|nr:alpha/beta fold hydrolase [Sphingomonas gilva]RHW18488.1 alpha/beta fold hydrolase [Sphingomonas gilva]
MIRRHLSAIAAAVLLGGASLPAFAAEDLPRRAWLGARLSPAPAGGFRVDRVEPGQTADRMGMRVGDVLIDDYPPNGRPPIAGADLTLRVKRGDRTLALKGKAVARPRESYAGGVTRYGSVDFGGGRLRDILVLPEGVEEPPIVFLIQGYTCTTIESPNPENIHRRVGADLIAAGIGYYRVEKPGVGDSSGGMPCTEMDFTTELDAFRAAYRHLTGELGVPTGRIIMLGHSMGGIQAPLLAAERPPRGIAVYGTVVRNWADYMHDLGTFQEFMLNGADPVKEYAEAQAAREAMRRFYFGGEMPARIAATSPALAAAARDAFGTDSSEQVFGRHARFWQQIAAIDLVKAWADTKSRVLSLYGESDVIALFDEDQRLIADIVNHYRPGTARYVGVPDTGHGMELTGSRAEIRARKGAPLAEPEPFNPAVTAQLVAWIKDTMKAPAAS